MVPKEFHIEDRTVILTGAARGIGHGVARVLAEAGAKVLVTALTDRYLRPLEEEMAAAGHPIETLAADATSSVGWQRTMELALERWDHVDVLINNLGDAIRKHIILPCRTVRVRGRFPTTSGAQHNRYQPDRGVHGVPGCRAALPGAA